VLKIRSIAVRDFGPFKGEQKIELPKEDGVVIVYGENMRGKTTLLNAIRYALFGKVLTRGSVEIQLHQIGNWESAASGKYGFHVVLAFEQNDDAYQLTRECRVRPGIVRPTSDLDYIEESFLTKNGSAMGPDEAILELGRLMPETVSRFFLFDGELLQQYEELLRSESDMGRQIKEAIERILGVPVLTNGRADLSQLHQDAQYQEAKAAQRNQKTQQLGNLHAELLGRREAMQQESSRLRQDLERLKVTKTAREEQAKKQEQLRALLGQRERLQEEIDLLNAKISEKEERRKNLLTTVWRGILAPKITVLRDQLEGQLRNLREQATRRLVRVETTESVRKALSSGICSLCEQALTDRTKQFLKERLAELGSDVEGGDTDGQIQHLERRISQLGQHHTDNSVAVVQEISIAIDDFKVTKSTTEDRLRDLKEQTEGLDESELRRIYGEYEKAVQEIAIVEKGLKAQDEALSIINTDIIRIETELVKKGGSDLQKERKRRELSEGLRNLFDEGVKVYRDRLRAKVEKDATALFLQLTSEPDYAGLSINNSYGLTIVHKDGNSIPVRSAGAEHVVALSLMGSLQKNAPLRGPIIMDSPFGRLDSVHTRKVIHTLPDMASQVVLFVYESELEPKLARSELKGGLRGEYRIVRRTARFSSVEKVV
jgi:DNA sulfur modification protein DndD